MKKKKLAMVFDSGAGEMYKEIKDSYLIPLTITEKDGKNLIEYKDLKTISTEEIYQKIRDGKDLSTAQMTVGDAYILIEDLLEKYEYVFVMPLTKGITGSLNTWYQIKDDIGNNHLVVFDTRDVGFGLVIQGMEIKRLFEKENKSIKEIEEYIDGWAARRNASLIVNDMDALIKGGRVSKFKGKIAKMLGLKILIEFHGGLEFKDKASSLEKIVDSAMKSIDEYTNFTKKGIYKVIFCNNLSKDEFKEYGEFKRLCKEWIKNKDLKYKKEHEYENKLPSVITVHTGVDSFTVYIVANE